MVTRSYNLDPIWNPNIAAFLSVPLTPAFGMYVQARNWSTLGESQRAQHAWLGFGIAVAFLIGISVLASVPGYGDTPSEMATTYYFAYLIIWYPWVGRTQGRYLKREYNGMYSSKSLALPCLVAIAIFIALGGIGTAFQ